MFEFRSPGLIRFGDGVLGHLGQEVTALGARRALIVCDPGIAALPCMEQAMHSLKTAGVAVEVFDGVDPEPLDQNVTAGLQAFTGSECDVVVSLGGGSPIDVGKAIAAMARNPGKIADYAVGGKSLPHPKASLVAIPTTAGTGSEVSRFTIITDTEKSVKLLINHPYLIPEVALVDPSLTISMPPALTMATGIDAFTHALEAFISVKATPMSDVFALEAIRLIAGNLRQAWANGNNTVAREAMMRGSLLAGMAFTNSSVALVHGMARPIGANFHVPHGLSNAVLLSRCMEFSMLGAPARFAVIANVMGEDAFSGGMMEGAYTGVEGIRDLCEEVEVPSLAELGVDYQRYSDLAPKMAADALASGSPGNNPRQATAEQIVDLYLSCY